jgi:hypothetical protein
MISPASRYPQLDGKLILPGSGGNLARVLFDAPSASAGLSLFHGGCFRWASRGVQLSRNARSVPACGLMVHSRKTRNPRDSFSEPLTAEPLPSVSYALNNRFDPLALSANALEKTPYTE